jgi:putative redox protein
MKAELKQVQGSTFVAKADSNHWVTMDDSINNGGSGAGAGPMELVLMALAGCTAMDVDSILKKKRAGMTKLEIEVTGERASEPPKVFTKIHIDYLIHGEVRRTDAEHAVSLSQEKYCSVSAMLKRTAEITYGIKIVE